MATTLFILMLMLLLGAAIFVKIAFFAIKLVFNLLFGFLGIILSLLFLPAFLAILLPAGAVVCILLLILGLIALPLVLPTMIILFLFLALPFIVIKRLVF
ncbi:MAG: hypothetical protein ABSE89_01530 [Sedimentisphaerales bacterium]